MAPIGNFPDVTRPKEIIEQTFNVFCGPQQIMDKTGFAKFCESSKKVAASDAMIIFSAVVQNVHSGMDLSEFKAALGVLVNFGKEISAKRGQGLTSAPRADRRPSLSECFEAPEVIKPARQESTRRKSLENHGQNTTVGLKPKTSSTFRWSPLDIVDNITGVQETRCPGTPSRTIRWCPAELEE